MSSIQKIYTSRDNQDPKVDSQTGNIGNTFVGEIQRLWYNPDTNCIYVSDGNTPGGIPVGCCGGGSGTANISVSDEGNVLTLSVSSFNFVGTGVTATSSGNAVTITIPGAGPTGATGATGPIGDNGATGAVGATGLQGATGATGPRGATGATGAVGSTGATGAQGATGATGPQGAIGATGAVGATGLQGSTGATGLQGSTGATGAQGTTGATGPTGNNGTDGSTGATGATGTPGDRYSTTTADTLSIATGNVSFTVGTGLAYTTAQDVIIAYDINNHMVGMVENYYAGNGAMTVDVATIVGSGSYSSWQVNLNGAQGIAGDTGATGATGVGTQGATGAQGATGPVGPQGATGVQGATGATGAVGATGLTGATGATGPQGVQGATGAVGASGATGPKGDVGATGPIGATGATGAVGATGVQGATGATGPQGGQGATGAQGSTGPQGATGVVGATGGFGYYGAFHTDQNTTLTNSINSNSTLPIVVGSTAGFYTSGWILIDAEVIAYTGVTSTSFTGITRGVAGTNGSNHLAGTPLSAAQVTPANVNSNVRIDVTDLSNGVTLNTTNGEVTCVNAGTYNFQFSVQVACAGNAPDDIVIWFVYNGTALPSSASYVTIPAIHAGIPGAGIVTINIFYPMAAGDRMRLNWTTLLGTSIITSYPPNYENLIGVPQSPGVIFTVNQIA